MAESSILLPLLKCTSFTLPCFYLILSLNSFMHSLIQQPSSGTLDETLRLVLGTQGWRGRRWLLDFQEVTVRVDSDSEAIIWRYGSTGWGSEPPASLFSDYYQHRTWGGTSPSCEVAHQHHSTLMIRPVHPKGLRSKPRPKWKGRCWQRITTAALSAQPQYSANEKFMCC